MVYFNAIVGYFNPGAASNIRDFIPLDNTFFCVLEGADIIETNSGHKTVEELYNSIYSKFGDQVFSIYQYPFLMWGNDTYYRLRNEIIRDWFPSIYNGCPNGWEFVNEENYKAGYQTAMYVPSLSVILMHSSFSSVGEDGTIKYVGSGYIIFGLYSHSTSTRDRNEFTCALPCIDRYTGPESLVNAKKFRFTVSYYGVRNFYWQVAEDTNNDYARIFGAGTPPDIIPGVEGPYNPGGESGEGDLPPGTFDDSSDVIEDSSLPSISAADTGFTRIYNPTLSQVQALARYLWTDETVLDTIWNHIKQFFEDPMQAIIGFNLVPCAVPDGGTRSFALMYIDTGVQMTAAASQFVDVDCGTVQLDRYYGAALDQNPYTKVSCFLPYIGMVHLNTDEVMGTTLHVKYRIDIVTGSCVAKIFVDGSLLYQYSGHCAINIPFSSADFSNYVTAAISVGAAVAGLAVGAAAGVGAVAESEALVVSEGAGPLTSAETMALVGGQSAEQTSGGTQAMFNGLSAKNITNTVGQVMGSKMQVEHAGSFSGNSGYLGVRRPFLLIERPNQCLPSSYGHLNGYPSMITLNLGECAGFTKVQQVQLTGVTATNPEQDEILQFLKSGVYL